MAAEREHWGSNLGFILAAAGSAVGLGNIWKFPYITGENGGGAFVLVYLLCIAVIGVPVMICEIALGRHTQRNPVGAFKQLNPVSCTMAHFIGLCFMLSGLFLFCFSQWGWGATALVIGALIFRYRWILVGAMGVLAGFVILSFYSVVAGWTLGYVLQAVGGQLTFANVAEAQEHFGVFIRDVRWAIGCHFAFIVICVLIVYHGIKSGIERWSKVLMPVLFLLLLALIIRGITLPGAMAGVRFYLSPDFSRIDAQSILVALGHAFFSLSLGMGAIITYGSYLRRDQNIFTSTLSIAALDTLVALMAGLAMFPAVFARGFAPDTGPGLVFQVLPAVFHQIPLGALWAFLFFLLLLVAAVTSGISLLEVVTAYFVDERRWPRRRAVVVFGAVIFLLGSLCAVSVADWSRIEPLHRFLVAAFGTTEASFFDVMDHMASNWMLPLGGLFISLFVGWVWGTRHAVDEIRHGSHNFADVHLMSLLAGLRDDPSHNSPAHVITLASLWGIFIRFISPVAVLIAFLNTIGWLDFT
ncbi:sodium-dependent transporter [Kiritimatiella glycovorans]|uniref:Transporter n=1 Tax=Kiritimatiella glycovorans TaxID=1307763 RepID=A0A0G3EAM8_9BACT|nr:sodium-dependent transporter [Kiritimatiella glycovorans]AKJ63531.1 Na+-dependent transporters of the SNF family protein [Kiritimatiella glycovorans]